MREYYKGVIPKEQRFTVQLGGQIYGIQDSVEQDLQTIQTREYEINSVVFAGGYYLELPCSAVQAMGAALFIGALLVASIWGIWRTLRKRPA
jgi:hypothetical protein